MINGRLAISIELDVNATVKGFTQGAQVTKTDCWIEVATSIAMLLMPVKLQFKYERSARTSCDRRGIDIMVDDSNCVS
ncbi:MAG: hypothetical protein WCG15_08880, partial [Actinomycetes bacterium]